MSTRSTIVYLPERSLHLYHEAGGEKLGVYLEYEAHDLEWGFASFTSPPDGPTMSVVLRLDGDDFDKLVNAYVEERDRRDAAQRERDARYAACPEHKFSDRGLPYHEVCLSCGFVRPE